jgi:hypothetical protein
MEDDATAAANAREDAKGLYNMDGIPLAWRAVWEVGSASRFVGVHEDSR